MKNLIKRAMILTICIMFLLGIMIFPSSAEDEVDSTCGHYSFYVITLGTPSYGGPDASYCSWVTYIQCLVSCTQCSAIFMTNITSDMIYHSMVQISAGVYRCLKCSYITQ